jgi:hypothetical protein
MLLIILIFSFYFLRFILNYSYHFTPKDCNTATKSIVQVKSEAHDKELYQQFKQDIDNEVADMRDLLRQHITMIVRNTHTTCFASRILGSHLTTDNQLEFCYRVCTQLSLYKSYQHNRLHSF